MSIFDRLFGTKKATPVAEPTKAHSVRAEGPQLKSSPEGSQTVVCVFFVTGERGRAPYGDLMNRAFSSLHNRGVTVEFLGSSQVAGHLPQKADDDIVEIALEVCRDTQLPSSRWNYELSVDGGNRLGVITIDTGRTQPTGKGYVIPPEQDQDKGGLAEQPT